MISNFTLESDILVYYIEASSFPEGVLIAHQALHKLVEYSPEHKYFGISYPNFEKGIVYKAAAEELIEGEFEKHSLNCFIIPKGDYARIEIKDFMKDDSSIQKAFQEFLKLPNLDPKGFCLEWYKGQNDCDCLIKLI